MEEGKGRNTLQQKKTLWTNKVFLARWPVKRSLSDAHSVFIS